MGKLKYQIDGEFKDVRVKASDTLPVGSIVEIPDDMEVPDGWEEAKQINKITTNYGDINYVKIGNLVHLEGVITGIVGQYQRITTLPLELRPREEYVGWMYISGSMLASISIKTTGNFQATHHNMNGGNYVADDILRINVTYLTE